VGGHRPDAESQLPSDDDHVVARDVAQEAGRLLVTLRAAMGAGRDAKLLRDEGDRRSHDLIMARMAELRPGDAILSEEGKDNLDRLTRDRVWIVDPLDGTREFGEPPRNDWAVHVALCIRGIPAAGAVALPAQDRLFSTGAPAVELPAAPARPRVAASRSRAPGLVAEVAAAFDAEIIYMGSAGAKAMAILSGDVDIYVHAGGQYEWDSAAPVAVAAAAGLHCSRIDGSPLRYNSPEPYLPDLLICRPELAGRALDALQVCLRQAASEPGRGRDADDNRV
jgi:3'(2'), 5'-bisphosphate nucleotidase